MGMNRRKPKPVEDRAWDRASQLHPVERWLIDGTTTRTPDQIRAYGTTKNIVGPAYIDGKPTGNVPMKRNGRVKIVKI